MGRPDVDGLNTGYAALLLEQYLDNPGAVPEEWRDLFESEPEVLLQRHPGLARLLERAAADGDGHATPVATPPPASASEPAPAPAVAEEDKELLGGIAASMALVKAIRMHGHLAARLDPLGSEPPGDPALEPERLIPKLTPELQARIPASLLRLHVEGDTLADALPRLLETYTGSIAYEIEHISDHEERVWLRQAIESGRYRRPLSRDERVRLLRRLSQVEGMERYLRRAFLGQKQFSVEGLDVMIPMLDEAIELAASDGAHEIVLGMAHRGRLNVLAHVVGRPYETILREFEGERTIEAVVSSEEGGSGDVKYHLGAQGTRSTPTGDITITLVANPSHLEAVDPVVEGRARAEQTDRSSRQGYHDPSVALPVLIHGDASFAGQGSVAETLNLQALAGYSTGGTLHLIANNQVGFTTDPESGRSTRYSSDLAKGFDIPIVHVNADDPEAALASIRLALAYRRRFGHDVVVDLVGYRRHGHNEQDEAAYTQPLLAAAIAEHPTAREQFAAHLVAEGDLTQEQADELDDDVVTELRRAHEALKETFGQTEPAPPTDTHIPAATGDEVVTALAADRLRALNEQLLRVPDGFTPNPKLMRQLERRRETLEEGGIDWGQAEALAFASLLVEGIPIRLTGQDTERGTFSHRHDVLHEASTGATFTPLQHLDDAGAAFEIYNSPLSEYACVGFEYGYAAAAPGGARALGGPVRRLRQRRADHHRPVHRRRTVEVARVDAPDAPPAARLRGQRTGALERPTRALPPARGAGEPADRELHDVGPVLPPLAAAGAGRDGAAARRHDPEGPAAAESGGLDARGSGERRVPACARRPKPESRARRAARALPGEDLLRHRRPRAARKRDRRRGGPDRAALPVPDRARAGRVRALPEPTPGRVGAGGAAEHGRLAGDPAPAGGDEAGGCTAPLCRPALAREPERGLSDRAPPRAGQNRPRRARALVPACG